jgi:hypothetical protein
MHSPFLKSPDNQIKEECVRVQLKRRIKYFAGGFITAITIFSVSICSHAAPIVRTDRYNMNYQYSSNPATRFVNVAKAQNGKTADDFAYGLAWCAFFVNDCASIAGVKDAIYLGSSDGGFAYQIYDNVLKAGGRVVKASERPQEGDLVFFHNNSKPAERFAHVGIMSSDTLTVHGNMSRKVIVDVPVSYYRLSDGTKNYTVTYLRPNYKPGNNMNSEVIDTDSEDPNLAGKNTDNSQAETVIKKSNLTYKVTKGSKVTLTGTTGTAKKISVPSTVKAGGKKYKVVSIAAGAFKGNKKITKITIGSNVTSIGKKAFYNCKNLGDITIDATSGVSIAKDSFKNIKKNAKIKIIAKDKKTAKKLMNKIKTIGGATGATLK